MNSKKNIIGYILIVLVVLAVIVALAVIKKRETENTPSDSYQSLKNYKVNEYIPTYISDSDMAKIYLNDYLTKTIYEPEEAYYLLDEEYRKLKYPTYNSYYSDVIASGIYNVEIETFFKKFKDGFIIFGIYDTNNNFYAFKTKGVMQYSVFLDDYTIEI